MPVLFGPQPVGQTTRRQLHVTIGKHGVLFDISPQLAAFEHRVLFDILPELSPFDQSFGQILALAHLINVCGLSIGHVHAIVVENLASF